MIQRLWVHVHEWLRGDLAYSDRQEAVLICIPLILDIILRQVRYGGVARGANKASIAVR